MFAGLYFLHRGKYTLAANLILFLSTGAMCAMTIGGNYTDAFTLTSPLYYLFIFIVLAAVFCSRE